ncbi:MAG: TIGR00282 family metallophosphoesterase [Sphaerochaetaceae bacterium]
MSKRRIFTALMLGDVIGHPGCRALFSGLNQLIRECRADFVVVNGENAAGGLGITKEIARHFFAQGVDVVTSGNHIWQQEGVEELFEEHKQMLRPANYPPNVPGRGWVVVEKGGYKVAVVNLQGRYQMPPIDCPFRGGKAIVDQLRKETPIILVHFHAELPQEKEALAFHLDGKVSVVVGTHTHVQTADEQILPHGTAYITDLGMCGSIGGVIGSLPSISIERQLTQLPLKNEVFDGPTYLQGVLCKIESDSGKALSIESISRQFG